MLQEKSEETTAINTTGIILFMVLVFGVVHIGFHATYIRHFPVFEKFNWVHHVHGALMASWTIMLVVQPFLIHRHKYTVHRFIGKLSYVIAPLILISIVLVAKYNYHSGVVKATSAEVFAKQSITWMQFFMFLLFYSLAIYNRKDTQKHMRFMIGTAIIMLGPGLGRALKAYCPTVFENFATLIPLYVKIAIAGVLLSIDIVKNKNWRPYAIVFSAFLLAAIVYHARYSGGWQSFGKFLVNYVY